MRRWILLAILCSTLRSEDLNQQLVARLTLEADAFRKIVPDLVGQETLFQRAVKQPSKGGFRVRVGASPQKAPEPVWQERRILSEYSFAAFSGEGGALHEMRRVTAVDGRKVQDPKQAQQDLAAIITAPGDKRKKELLEQFEKHGLVGAVTDFGQLLLLFNSRDVQHYEFAYRRSEIQGVARLLVFGYQQLDGPEGLTVIDGTRGGPAHTIRIGGEIWVRENGYVPVRITLVTTQDEGTEPVREEASVDYAPSAFGTLLPLWTEHRELRNGNVVVENKFSYTDFHKFHAESEIKFNSK